MPNMFGGDQWDSEYAPDFYEEGTLREDIVREQLEISREFGVLYLEALEEEGNREGADMVRKNLEDLEKRGETVLEDRLGE